MTTSPFQAPSTGDDHSSDVNREVQRLYRLVLTTLAALIVLAFGFNLYLLNEFLTARTHRESAERVVKNLSVQYRQKEPAMRQFIAALQSFAIAHPDFQPTLQRYRRALPQFFTEPSGSISNRSTTAPPTMAR